MARNVSATARRHGLSNGQLFSWRRLAREGKFVVDNDAAGFVPAIVLPEHPMDERPVDNDRRTAAAICGTEPSPACRIEIVLSDPRRVIVDRDVDGAALARVVSVLERR